MKKREEKEDAILHVAENLKKIIKVTNRNHVGTTTVEEDDDWRCLECEPDQLRVHQGREEAGVAEHEEELQQRGRPAPTTPSRPPIYSVITSRTNKPSGVTAGGSFVPMGKEEGGSNTPTWLRT